MKTFKQINEVKSQSAVFAFGRFNPPTVGHLKLANRVKHVAGSKADAIIYTGFSQDPKKNPLSYRDKIKFMKAMFKSSKVLVDDGNARTVFDVATNLYNDGYREIKMVAGSDRIKEFENLLTKYNNVKGRHGFYNFKSIHIVSAGERDPDAEGVEGMSASKMRQLAGEGREQEFIKAMPRGFRLGKQLYKAVRKGMGLKEEFSFLPDYIKDDIGREIRTT